MEGVQIWPASQSTPVKLQIGYDSCVWIIFVVNPIYLQYHHSKVSATLPEHSVGLSDSQRVLSQCDIQTSFPSTNQSTSQLSKKNLANASVTSLNTCADYEGFPDSRKGSFDGINSSLTRLSHACRTMERTSLGVLGSGSTCSWRWN